MASLRMIRLWHLCRHTGKTEIYSGLSARKFMTIPESGSISEACYRKQNEQEEEA